jgi:hypothetical protein
MVFEKLEELNNDILEYRFHEETVTVSVPAQIAEIRKKWDELSHFESEEEKIRKQNIQKQKKVYEERSRKREQRKEAARKVELAAADLETRSKKLADEYHKNIKAIFHKIQNTRFQPGHILDDPKFIQLNQDLDNTIQVFGDRIRALVNEERKNLNSNDKKAEPEAAIHFYKAVYQAYDYVAKAQVSNKNLNIHFEYKALPDVLKAMRAASDSQEALFSKRIELESQEEKNLQEEQRFYQALNYGVDEKDLETHKAYLDVKAKLDNAKFAVDYEKLQAEFLKLNGYLDSKSLADKCHTRFNALNRIETAKKEYDHAAERLSNAGAKLNTYQNDLDKTVDLLNQNQKDLQKAKTSYEQNKQNIENAGRLKISELETKLSSEESKKDNVVKELAEAKNDLEKTFALAFSKKKAFQQRIQDLEALLPPLDSSIAKLKENMNTAEAEMQESLQKLDSDIENLESEISEEKETIKDLNKKIPDAKKELKAAQIDFERKKKRFHQRNHD